MVKIRHLALPCCLCFLYGVREVFKAVPGIPQIIRTRNYRVFCCVEPELVSLLIPCLIIFSAILLYTIKKANTPVYNFGACPIRKIWMF